MQVQQKHNGAHDESEGAHGDALGEHGAGRIRCDDGRERVHRGERRADGAGHEDSAHDHNGVVAQRDEDRRENRVEGHGLLLQAAHGASEDHEHRHAEHEQKLAALGLLREGGKAAFEGARHFHDADKTAQAQDEHHDVDAVDHAPDHGVGNVGKRHRMRIEPFIGAGNRHRLGDGAARELIDVDFHAQLIERLLGRIKLGHLAGRRGHLQLAALGIVEQLRVLAGRHEPRADDGNDGHDEQNRERRREGELALLPFLFGLGGRDGNGFHGCLGHDDLLSESGRNAVMPSHGPPSESPSEPLLSTASHGRMR